MNVIKSIASLFLLILLSPFLVLISLVILIEDGRPVIFKQERLGQNNKVFLIYKFRTMKKYTPELETKKLDPKKFLLFSGSFLRKFSLDETLNLINVFKMEMNFIGYRPSLRSQISLNKKRSINGIFHEKPGITGLAQVNGRDKLDDENKIYFEKKYLKRQNFLLDIKIIVLTFFKILDHKNIIH